MFQSILFSKYLDPESILQKTKIQFCNSKAAGHDEWEKFHGIKSLCPVTHCAYFTLA